MDIISTKHLSKKFHNSHSLPPFWRFSFPEVSNAIYYYPVLLTEFLAVYRLSQQGDTVMPLTDTAIRNAKSKERPYKLYDAKGLYLLVNMAGKYFRFDYRFAGKRKTLALGVYPGVRLVEAREKRDEARKLLQNSIDPCQHKKAIKARKMEKLLSFTDESSIGPKLLEDIRDLFMYSSITKIFSGDLKDRLNGLEERAWGDLPEGKIR